MPQTREKAEGSVVKEGRHEDVLDNPSNGKQSNLTKKKGKKREARMGITEANEIRKKPKQVKKKIQEERLVNNETDSIESEEEGQIVEEEDIDLNSEDEESTAQVQFFLK